MRKIFNVLTVVAVTMFLVSCGKESADADLRYKVVGSDIIVDASDFLDDIPRLHLVQDAASLGVDWLYNDFAIQFRTHADFTISNYFKDVTFPESGTYYLYVRAVGQQYAPYGQRSRASIERALLNQQPGQRPVQVPEGSNGAFRLRVNDAYVEGSFGDKLGAEMKRAGVFEVEKGEVAHLMITRITGSPALDCIVLSKNPNLTEEDLMDKQLPDYMELLHEYAIPQSSCVKFGDLTGDGKTDFVVFSSGYSSYAFDHSGKMLWSWEAPEENTRLRAQFEAPGLVWDFDRDGKAELVQWREFDGKEWLIMADGMTGKILQQTPWPTAPHPHVYNNFRLAVANTDGIYPASVLLYSDCGRFMTYGIYDMQLNEKWRHEVNTKKDHLGHYFYAHDFTNDGIDEIVGGWRVVDADGNIMWSRLEDIYDNHDHVDSYSFADMNGDGRDDIVICACDLGVQVRDALTGELMTIAPAEHTQQIEAGNFLDGYKLPQMIAGARIYKDRQADPYIASQVYWYDGEGKMITHWPMNGLNGNPDIVMGDFYGDGTDVAFWYKFLMQPDGRGKLCVRGNIYQCTDFERNGAAQVITLDGTVLRVWGYKHVKAGEPNNDPDFLKETMANHTHY
ncbi:MAG: hypothetical protein J6K90_00420 [Tidjanibacter sp.]|nr:hypothetical protein [Tidjanibacter sp.]